MILYDDSASVNAKDSKTEWSSGDERVDVYSLLLGKYCTSIWQ